MSLEYDGSSNAKNDATQIWPSDSLGKKNYLVGLVHAWMYTLCYYSRLLIIYNDLFILKKLYGTSVIM